MQRFEINSGFTTTESIINTAYLFDNKIDVFSSKVHTPFGSVIPGRSWSEPSLTGTYKYGFNGQEKEDKVAGENNIYSAEYWMYDGRLGKRFNIDPIVKDWESPYACFNNSPISKIDPYGLDGQPNAATNTVKANVFIAPAAGSTVTPANLNSCVFAIEQNIENVYQANTNGGRPVNMDVNVIPITLAQMAMLSQPGGLTIGGATYRLGDGMTNAITITDIPGVVSACNSKNTGQWNIADILNTPNTAAHEFGHLLGLSDRYAEGGQLNTGTLLLTAGSRQTTPLALPTLTATWGYNPSTNLMSSMGNTINQDQMNIIFSSGNEQNYPAPYMFTSLSNGWVSNYPSILVTGTANNMTVIAYNAAGNVLPTGQPRMEWLWTNGLEGKGRIDNGVGRWPQRVINQSQNFTTPPNQAQQNSTITRGVIAPQCR